MSRLVPLDLMFKMEDTRMPLFPKPIGVVAEDLVDDKVGHIRDHFMRYSGRTYGAKTHRIYFMRFVLCEFLNLINVVGQIFFVDLFLGGMFTSYGVQVVEVSNLDPEERVDPMNIVFPKVAKCTFQRFGPTGTIETFDGLCVLPINILNEKIYIFLWFWFVILSIITGIFLVYRLILICSRAARKSALRARANLLVDEWTIGRIVDRITIGDWFFLMQLGMNLDPFVFAKLLQAIDAALMRFQGVPNHVDAAAEKGDKIA